MLNLEFWGRCKDFERLQPWWSFGELALLYNAPIAATIKAIGDCILYVLDRETFNWQFP